MTSHHHDTTSALHNRHQRRGDTDGTHLDNRSNASGVADGMRVDKGMLGVSVNSSRDGIRDSP